MMMCIHLMRAALQAALDALQVSAPGLWGIPVSPDGEAPRSGSQLGRLQVESPAVSSAGGSVCGCSAPEYFLLARGLATAQLKQFRAPISRSPMLVASGRARQGSSAAKCEPTRCRSIACGQVTDASQCAVRPGAPGPVAGRRRREGGGAGGAARGCGPRADRVCAAGGGAPHLGRRRRVLVSARAWLPLSMLQMCTNNAVLRISTTT